MVALGTMLSGCYTEVACIIIEVGGALGGLTLGLALLAGIQRVTCQIRGTGSAVLLHPMK